MAIQTLRNRRIFTRSDLDGSGIVKRFADLLISRINQIIVVLNNLVSTDTSTGEKTVYFNVDNTTYIKFNATDNSLEFWINGSLEGILDSNGWSTEPS